MVSLLILSLLPYALTCLVMLAIESVGAIRHGTWHNVLSMVGASFMGGGVPFEYQLFGYQDGIGAIWFLMALFVCRNIYNLLHKHFSKNVLSFVCLVLSIGAVYYFNHVGVLPWNILQGLSVLVFYDFGVRMKAVGNYKKEYLIPAVILIAAWILALLYSEIHVVRCAYEKYPLDVLGAIGGTMIIWAICFMISKRRSSVVDFLSWIGRNSLPVLCLHLVDLNCQVIHKIDHMTFNIGYQGKYLHTLLVLVSVFALIYSYQLFRGHLRRNCLKNA